MSEPKVIIKAKLPKRKMKRALESVYKERDHYPSMYDMPVFVDWAVDGVKEITVNPEHFHALMTFALVNNMVSYSESGFTIYGMKITKEDVPTDHSR